MNMEERIYRKFGVQKREDQIACRTWEKGISNHTQNRWNIMSDDVDLRHCWSIEGRPLNS